mmetsp:Transcript_43521/g.134498  ORF Transcript_43521/g.134498 Transcript_43521/m.134498 type:complete len:220 (+) Transcript_43521:278-937(+)
MLLVVARVELQVPMVATGWGSGLRWLPLAVRLRWLLALHVLRVVAGIALGVLLVASCWRSSLRWPPLATCRRKRLAACTPSAGLPLGGRAGLVRVGPKAAGVLLQEGCREGRDVAAFSLVSGAHVLLVIAGIAAHEVLLDVATGFGAMASLLQELCVAPDGSRRAVSATSQPRAPLRAQVGRVRHRRGDKGQEGDRQECTTSHVRLHGGVVGALTPDCT